MLEEVRARLFYLIFAAFLTYKPGAASDINSFKAMTLMSPHCETFDQAYVLVLIKISQIGQVIPILWISKPLLGTMKRVRVILIPTSKVGSKAFHWEWVESPFWLQVSHLIWSNCQKNEIVVLIDKFPSEAW